MSTVVGGIVAPAMWSVGWLRRLCGGGWFVKSDFTSPLDRVKCVNVLLKCVFIKHLVFMNYGLRAFYNFSNVWFDVGDGCLFRIRVQCINALKCRLS